MKFTTSTEIEWATITPDKVVVANTESVWICSSLVNDGQFAEAMTGKSNSAKTSKLLDGAIAAGKEAIPFGCKPPTLTPNQLIWQLIDDYHLAYATPMLMREASRRFTIALRHELGNWAFERAKVEADRARLILLDIESLGYKAEELVQAIVPSVSTTLLDYFKRGVGDIDPIDCVGYIHATDRLSLNARQDHLQKISYLLPTRNGADWYLNVCSSPGENAQHLVDNVDMISRLSSRERLRVMRSCYETALLLFSLPREGYLSEIELECLLEPFRLEV